MNEIETAGWGRSSLISHRSSFIICPLESAPVKKALALLAIVVIACGKRGDPRPPVPVVPQATTDLLVTQRASKLILSWSYPSLTTAGRQLTGIRRISVYRYVEELPVPQGGRDPNTMLPGDVDPTVPRPIALFSKIPTVPPTQFAKLATRIDSMESANLGAATSGAKLTYEDLPPFRTTDGRPVRITYAVVTEATSRGDFSNLVTIVPVDVPAAPANLVATPKAEGVVLTWNAVTPALAGYNVYRTAVGQEPDIFAVPLNPAPVTATTFTDKPAYGEHEYRVSAVASASTPRIESGLSAPVRATFKDLVPPPAPASITPLIEPKAVRLIWEPVEAGDLAGYMLYRAEGVGHGEDVKEIGRTPLVDELVTTTSYVDTKADLGIAYRYAVAARDTSRNESPLVWTPWVVVPKTP